MIRAKTLETSILLTCCIMHFIFTLAGKRTKIIRSLLPNMFPVRAREGIERIWLHWEPRHQLDSKDALGTS